MDGSKREPIPEHFESAEQAGEFWDVHSAADYWDEMEEVEMEFDIQKHVFLIPVNDRVYYRVKQRAEEERRSIEEVVSGLLERELT